ncbi:MAG: YbjN domain-containing protein [Actinomycetes bacterium]
MLTDKAINTVGAFLESLPEPARSVAYGEWGLTVESAGWPLEMGIAVRDGLLRFQALVCGPGQLDNEDLLWWNRRIHLVRFSATRSGEIWLCCDILPEAVNPRQLDRVMGLFVLTATQAREKIHAEELG